jgi:hypothetical protein
VLDRIASQTRARAFREVRTRMVVATQRCWQKRRSVSVSRRRSAAQPLPHAYAALPAKARPRAGDTIAEKGAENVVVADLGYVFFPRQSALRQARSGHA